MSGECCTECGFQIRRSVQDLRLDKPVPGYVTSASEPRARVHNAAEALAALNPLTTATKMTPDDPEGSRAGAFLG